MKRVTRLSDVRDASLPPANPERDELGSGFVMSIKEWTIEYRRAYIRISRGGPRPIFLLIRNNSTYFGRDRLDDATYVSWEAHGEDELLGLTRAQLADSDLFTPWTELLKANDQTNTSEKMRRLGEALDVCDQMNNTFATWLIGEGINPLSSYLEERLLKNDPIFIGFVEGAAPSWQPVNVRSVNAEEIAAIKRRNLFQFSNVQLQHARLVLMSSENGDLPLGGVVFFFLKLFEQYEEVDEPTKQHG